MSVDLVRHARAPANARRAIERHFRECGVAETTIDDALLVVTELVNNAVEHGRGQIELRLRTPPNGVRIEVVDEGEGATSDIQGYRDSGGWGLRVVDHLALEWGAHEGTTHVWAVLERH